ncbi:YlaH-like family protein [Ferviditalea candida]|uniref:YlaH-like family protein n=1 Tax=Ferviditalea candida TaxID=3108399 RepID=A0ABU5ZDS4_9BACL|nr:YlaH-like family protein [Paenibacillaceae bacterium T2]
MNGTGDTSAGFTDWLAAHPWITYFLIYVFLVYIYNKVFRVRKLPLLKDLIVYLLIALGAFMLLFFQIGAGLPIVMSLMVAIALMLVVRIRQLAGTLGKKRQ